MASFAYAIENKVDMIELDCRLSKDGIAIVIHDEYVDRTMEGKGKISDMTLNEIKKLKWKINKDEKKCDNKIIDKLCNKYLDHPIPTLEEVIKLCVSHNVGVMVEIKPTSNYKICHIACDLIKKYDCYESCFIAAFNPLNIYQTRRYDSKVETCLLMCYGLIEDSVKKNEAPLWLRYTYPLFDPILTWMCYNVLPYTLGVGIIGIHNILISQDLVKKYLDNGIITDVWVCNDEAEMKWLHPQKVVFTTDKLFSGYRGLQEAFNEGGKSK